MKLVHSIRLKGPWNYRWLKPDYRALPAPPFAESGRIPLPADWKACFAAASGTVQWTRRFQRPTNLDPGERVYLNLGRNSGIEAARLNDSPLEPVPIDDGNLRFDLTPLLQPSNVFECTQTAEETDVPAGLSQPVIIEIWRADEK